MAINILLFMNFICFSSFICITAYKYKKYKSAYILSPIFWFMLFYFTYFMIPVFTLDIVENNPDLFGSFIFSKKTKIITMGVIFFESLFLLLIQLYHKPNKFRKGFTISKRCIIIEQLCNVILIVFFLTSLFSLYKMLMILKQHNFLESYFLLDSESEIYRKQFKFYTIRYFAITASFYKFCKSKNYKTFLAFIPNIAFEIIAGKRTTVFLYVLFVYLVIVKVTNKTYVKIMLIVCIALLVSVLFARLTSIKQTDELHLDAILAGSMAEFINTFLTLPAIIEKGLIGKMKIIEILYSFCGPLLPGSINSSIMNACNFVPVGSYFAKDVIGKGYGLGANIISYSLFAYGILGMLVLPITAILILYIEKKFKKDSDFLLTFFVLYNLRLFMRQGIESLIVTIYIAVVYVGIFYLLRRKNILYVAQNAKISFPIFRKIIRLFLSYKVKR